MRKLHLVLFVLTSYFGLSQNANEALVAFHKNTFPEAKLTVLSPRVTVAFAYSYKTVARKYLIKSTKTTRNYLC